MKIEYPFYIPFFYFDCDFFEDIKKDLIDVIMEYHNAGPFKLHGKFPESQFSKKNITESEGNFFAIENNSIKRLREWIGPNLVQGYKSLDIVTKKITFTESWFHVAKKGGYHNFHFHRDAPLAGIFYIQSGNCEIGNRWLNPFPGYLDKHSSKWCSQNFNTTFKPGQLILFPGWLLHSAVPHESDELRIVLAFNTAPE